MSRQRSGAAPSQRQLRVGEQMRHLLVEHLVRGDLHNRHLESVSITVSEVRMSRDLRNAHVFVTELGRDVQQATLEALGRVAPLLGGRLAREMNLKYAPKLRFEADTSFSYAAKIDNLLQEGLASRPQPAPSADASDADSGQRDEP
jgi:ribosome-binding factor A